MDPTFITPDQWALLRSLVHSVWFYLLFLVLFAGSLLLALAVLPSLVHTRHLPPRALRVRPLLALVALAALAGLALSLASAVATSDVVGQVYSRYFF